MKFNVVIPKHAFESVKKEFPRDNIIIFNENILKEYVQDTVDFVFDEEKLMLFKFILIKKYKDLIFIDYPNIMIKPGLRKEIIQLRKTKDQFFYFNKNLDIFYSKSCLNEIDDILYKVENIKDISYIKNFSLFMVPYSREYSFENILFYGGLKYYIEFFLRSEKILLLNLNKSSFDYKKYKKLIKDGVFLLGYNALQFETGTPYNSNNLLLIDFDVDKLPIRYDLIKTYKNIETEKMYVGYFSEINCKGVL